MTQVALDAACGNAFDFEEILDAVFEDFDDAPDAADVAAKEFGVDGLVLGLPTRRAEAAKLAGAVPCPEGLVGYIASGSVGHLHLLSNVSRGPSWRSQAGKNRAAAAHPSYVPHNNLRLHKL
jgi:hypothetical protein